MIFCGIDWAERHHDVALVDEQGKTLATRRIADDAAGLTEVLGLLAEHTGAGRDGAQFVAVDVALETDHGLLVVGLRAAGHRVFAINPKAVDRYRDRYAPSGAKSDPADALVLAHLLRTDRDRHRPMPADSEQVTALGVLARAHQDAVRAGVRDAARLRCLLREFFPAALVALPNLNTRTAVTVLAAAPTPGAAAALSEDQLRQLLAGIRRGVPRTLPARMRTAFTAGQVLRQPPVVEAAMATAAQAVVRTLSATLDAIAELETALDAHFEQHPDAEIVRSLPGLGLILGARVLSEFGDDPTRFTDAASRRAYAGAAPITRASGRSRVVLMRRACNHRLADACRWWAIAATQRDPGAQACYQHRRDAGDGHEAALRRLAGKLIGQLHYCLVHRCHYDPSRAWSLPGEQTQAA